MTNLQKKKIWYSFLGLMVVGMLIIISLILWTNLIVINSELKAKISSAITLYGGLALLGIKVLIFAFDLLFKSYKKTKDVVELVKETKEVVSKGENMIKKKTSSKETVSQIAEQASDLKLDVEMNNFNFSIRNKSITISPKKEIVFTNAEDYFNKLKTDNSNFLEYMRKYFVGEK